MVMPGGFEYGLKTQRKNGMSTKPIVMRRKSHYGMYI